MEWLSLNTFDQKGVFTLLVACLLVTMPAWAQSGGAYEITWSTIDGGGGVSSGGAYVLRGTIGQPDAGYHNGGDYEILGGYWVGEALCVVEFDDFARFAEYWLGSGSGLPSDLDSDNDVDAEDLGWFAAHWLDYCPVGWQLK